MRDLFVDAALVLTLSMAKALLQTKAMDQEMHRKDMELQKEDNERRALMFEQSERDAANMIKL